MASFKMPARGKCHGKLSRVSVGGKLHVKLALRPNMHTLCGGRTPTHKQEC